MKTGGGALPPRPDANNLFQSRTAPVDAEGYHSMDDDTQQRISLRMLRRPADVSAGILGEREQNRNRYRYRNRKFTEHLESMGRGSATFNPQPSTFNLQPVTFNLQPSTFNLQPVTFNLQPATFNPQPETRYQKSRSYASDFFCGTWPRGRGLAQDSRCRSRIRAPICARMVCRRPNIRAQICFMVP